MDTIVVVIVVLVALGYALSRAWSLFKPKRGAPGCGCSQPKSACSGCPLVKR